MSPSGIHKPNLGSSMDMDAPLTPKIQNKRRSPSCSSSIVDFQYGIFVSGGEGASAASDTFDCQTLQRCLKKVRLTTNISPGELRLQRDLRHAVLSRQWLPVQDECEWRIPYQPPLLPHGVEPLPQPPQHRCRSSSLTSSSSSSTTRRRHGCREESEDDCMFQDVSVDEMNDNDVYTNERNTNATAAADSAFIDPNQVSVKVTRDEQDPLELVLHIDVTTYHHPMVWSSSNTDTATSTVSGQTLHLQFPRLYPHRPPVVRRIEHHQSSSGHSRRRQPLLAPVSRPQSSHVDRWTAGNLTHSNWSCSSDNTVSTGSSGHGHPSHRDYIPTDEVIQSSCGGLLLQRIVIAASPDNAAEVQAATCTPGTIILTEWSPVSRLTDICDWLIQAVVSWHVKQGGDDDDEQQTNRKRRFQQRKSSGMVDLDTLSTTLVPSNSNSSSSSSSDDSSPSTPTTTNCSLTLRHRSSGEEKKDTEDGLFWDDRTDEVDASFHHPMIYTDHVDWSRSPTDRAGTPEPQGSTSLSSSDFLPNGRFDVGYDHQIPQPDDLADVMDCQDDG